MEFIVEEIDIKEEVDMDGDPEGQHDFIPDSHDWKLNPNVRCRVTLKRMKDFTKMWSTESQSKGKIGDGMCIDPDRRVHHVDLDLSDMFLINKTIKVEPTDVEMNSDDPLALFDLKYCAAESGIKSADCRSSNIPNNAHDATRPKKIIHKCDVCKKDFDFKCRLTQHKFIHGGVKPHRCELCGKDFALNCDLIRHKKTHSRGKAHRCDVCGKHFALNSHLTRHKLRHTLEKGHMCDVCGKGFIRNYELTRHKVIHTGEKPHTCDICGMNFALFSVLNQHKLTHAGVKPHRCNVCGMEFVRNYNLIRHKVTHNVKCDMLD